MVVHVRTISFSSVVRGHIAGPRHSYAETALSVLVKGLPEMLMRQFEYEDPIVRGGKHLLHSAFFKELVALACDLVCTYGRTASLAFVVVFV